MSADVDPVQETPPAPAPPKAIAMQALADAPPITPRRRKPVDARRSRRRRRLVLGLLLVLAGGGAAFYWQPLKQRVNQMVMPKTDGGLANIQTFTARRGQLRISIVEEGKLRAVKNHTIMMGVSGKITWLAEAGAKIKKGDKLVTLDSKQYEDQRRASQGDLDGARQTLVINQQAVPISRSNGEAAVSAAKTKLSEAELALKQYTTIDVPKKLNEFETTINDTRSKLADAQKKRADAQAQLDDKLMDDGPEKRALEQQITLAKQQVDSMQKVLITLEDQRKMFRAYNYPQDTKSKQQAVVNARLEVTKAEVQAKSDLLSKEADVRKAQNLITRYENDIRRYDDMIEKCTATAPAEGLVFYGSPDMDRWGDMTDRIRVGSDWYSGYPIMTIPDLSSFQVNLQVPEVYRGRVTTSMPATITIDAVPGLVLEGTLTTLASVARNKLSWDSSSPQVFDATIALGRADERMVAGMTVQAEILTASLKDVIFVPIEAVFNEEGKTASFFWIEDAREAGGGHIEKRPVLTGQTNDHFVEIARGVKEGDRMLLSRPASFVTPQDYHQQVEAMFPAATSSRPAETVRAPRVLFVPDSAPAGSAPASSPAATGAAPGAGTRPE